MSRRVPLEGSVSPRLLVPPGSHLFRAGTEDFSDDTSLPFVDLPSHDAQRSCWRAPKPNADDPRALSEALAFGRRSAAAYFLFLQVNGPDALPLAWIAQSMAEAKSRNRAAEFAFWHYLSRLMWLGSHHLTPAAVAADVEAVVIQEASFGDDDVIATDKSRETTR